MGDTDIGPILLAAQSADPAVRQPAEQQLEAAKASNLVCRPSARPVPALGHIA
jgi:hypothetical protein